MLEKELLMKGFRYLPWEVVERSFRSVLLATNMSSYVPKCAKETSDPYFRCYQQNSFTLPLFCWLLSLAGHIPSLNINNLTHAYIFQALSCWISSARQKDKLLLCSQAFFCLNPVPNVYSTTPVEVLLELLLLTRNPSLLVLKIYGKANFLKMLIDVDHDNLRTVLLQTPNTSHSYPF